ncbi:hypothetical protein [Mycolicibacterium sphagni]|uniref:hypothetical protein n=1 Tax=Mycolicibacterium sphagni TaxID=1786 RepID=UPI0021F346EA|nr:hypothetical protein [Mycolicibacterium sphagni]MCV7174882.1 hypothetical protein [Mycolicibacterium sphagni]
MTAAPTAPSITCPRCDATSYHPDDIRYGYCGRCQGWTSDPQLPTWPLSELRPVGKLTDYDEELFDELGVPADRRETLARMLHSFARTCQPGPARYSLAAIVYWRWLSAPPTMGR